MTLERAALRIEFSREHPHRPTYRIDNHLSFPISVSQVHPPPSPLDSYTSPPPLPVTVIGAATSQVWAWSDLTVAGPFMLSLSFATSTHHQPPPPPPPASTSGSASSSLRAPGPVPPCGFEYCTRGAACLLHVPFESIGFHRPFRVQTTTKVQGKTAISTTDIDVAVSTDGPTRVLSIKLKAPATERGANSAEQIVKYTHHRSIVLQAAGLGVSIADRLRREMCYVYLNPIYASQVLSPQIQTVSPFF